MFVKFWAFKISPYKVQQVRVQQVILIREKFP